MLFRALLWFAFENVHRALCLHGAASYFSMAYHCHALWCQVWQYNSKFVNQSSTETSDIVTCSTSGLGYSESLQSAHYVSPSPPSPAVCKPPCASISQFAFKAANLMAYGLVFDEIGATPPEYTYQPVCFSHVQTPYGNSHRRQWQLLWWIIAGSAFIWLMTFFLSLRAGVPPPPPFLLCSPVVMLNYNLCVVVLTHVSQAISNAVWSAFCPLLVPGVSRFCWPETVETV